VLPVEILKRSDPARGQLSRRASGRQAAECLKHLREHPGRFLLDVSDYYVILTLTICYFVGHDSNS
jgi:hypothetical protein